MHERGVKRRLPMIDQTFSYMYPKDPNDSRLRLPKYLDLDLPLCSTLRKLICKKGTDWPSDKRCYLHMLQLWAGQLERALSVSWWYSLYLWDVVHTMRQREFWLWVSFSTLWGNIYDLTTATPIYVEWFGQQQYRLNDRANALLSNAPTFAIPVPTITHLQ